MAHSADSESPFAGGIEYVATRIDRGASCFHALGEAHLIPAAESANAAPGRKSAIVKVVDRMELVSWSSISTGGHKRRFANSRQHVLDLVAVLDLDHRTRPLWSGGALGRVERMTYLLTIALRG